MRVCLTIYVAKQDITSDQVLKIVENILKTHLPQYIELEETKGA